MLFNCQLRGESKYQVMETEEEDTRRSVLLSCGVQALLEAKAGLEIDHS